MKLYKNIKNDKTIQKMVIDLVEGIKRDLQSDKFINKVPKVLVMTDTIENSRTLFGRIAEELMCSQFHEDKPDIITVTTLDEKKVTFYMATGKYVSVAGLTSYDRVIINDIITHHPYDEKILVRGTVE